MAKKIVLIVVLFGLISGSALGWVGAYSPDFRRNSVAMTEVDVSLVTKWVKSYDMPLESIWKVWSCDLNKDNTPDYIIKFSSTGCGLTAFFSEISFIVSTPDGHKVSHMGCMEFDPEDIVLIDDNVCFILNAFCYWSTENGHNYWHFRLYGFDLEGYMFDANTLRPKIFPAYIHYTYKENHKLAKELSDSDKIAMWDNAQERFILKGTKIKNYPSAISQYLENNELGLKELDRYYKVITKQKENFTTHDSTNWAVERNLLTKTLLNNTIMDAIDQAPKDVARSLLNYHYQWLEHYKYTYPTITDSHGTGRALQNFDIMQARMLHRHDIAKLPFADFLIYNEIANTGVVHYEKETVKMHHGEVILKLNSYLEDAEYDFYFEFKSFLVPQSCKKIVINNQPRYMGIIGPENLYDSGLKFFLYFWNEDGKIATSINLAEKFNMQIKKIQKVKVENNKISITYLDSNDKELTSRLNIL